MTGEERRKKIADIIETSSVPVSGTDLAGKLNVSRQVIVQDIALLRAAREDILSTNKGYILKKPDKVKRVFRVKHSDEEVPDELNSIVDCGGCIEDVFIEHSLYGRLSANMGIKSRRDVEKYMNDVGNQPDKFLKKITSDFHYHTISAESEEILDEIAVMLADKGFLM